MKNRIAMIWKHIFCCSAVSTAPVGSEQRMGGLYNRSVIQAVPSSFVNNEHWTLVFSVHITEEGGWCLNNRPVSSYWRRVPPTQKSPTQWAFSKQKTIRKRQEDKQETKRQTKTGAVPPTQNSLATQSKAKHYWQETDGQICQLLTNDTLSNSNCCHCPNKHSNIATLEIPNYVPYVIICSLLVTFYGKSPRV